MSLRPLAIGTYTLLEEELQLKKKEEEEIVDGNDDDLEKNKENY